MSWRLARIYHEAALAAAAYSNSRKAKVDPDGGRWVVIYDFPLPAGFNFRSTGILLLLPSSYPETPPDWFYLDKGLRRSNGSKPGHYYENKGPGNGWGGGCLHFRTWRSAYQPLDGHSLVSIGEVIRQTFQRWLHN